MLFDTSADPDELVNLAALDPDPNLRSSLLAELTDAMLHADDLTRVEPVTVDLTPQDLAQPAVLT